MASVLERKNVLAREAEGLKFNEYSKVELPGARDPPQPRPSTAGLPRERPDVGTAPSALGLSLCDRPALRARTHPRASAAIGR